MPMYEYGCGACGGKVEDITAFEKRDALRKCPACGEVMSRLVTAPKIGKPGYQMKAVLTNGQHVKGHFGKDAKRDKSGRRKK